MLCQSIAEQYGLVVFPEKAIVGLMEHTLLILERGLVCVRSRLSSVIYTRLCSYKLEWGSKNFSFF